MLVRMFDLVMLMLSVLRKREDSFVEGFQNMGANVIKIKLVVKNLGTTSIGNTNMVVVNNHHLSLESKSELVSFGRVF